MVGRGNATTIHFPTFQDCVYLFDFCWCDKIPDQKKILVREGGFNLAHCFREDKSLVLASVDSGFRKKQKLMTVGVHTMAPYLREDKKQTEGCQKQNMQKDSLLVT